MKKILLFALIYFCPISAQFNPCYDDLDLESFDWNDILSLEGDENVYVTTEEKYIDW